MIALILTVAAALGAALVAPHGAAADTFRFEAADGTVYYTNAPTDPTYVRMGFTSGTKAGFLRLPRPEVATSFLPEITEAAERHGVPVKLVHAVIRVESGFNPRAVSPKGARGLMQLMPQTASLLGVRDSFNPVENINGGVRHLKQLIDRFRNNLPLALAAYNAGEQAVTHYRGVPPYPETQGYVTKVMSFAGEGTDGASATVAGPAARPMPTFRRVDDDGTIVYTNIPSPGRRRY